MYIKRDISPLLSHPTSWIQVLLGPRQCGKSTLFAALFADQQSASAKALPFKEITFDDLSLRQLANQDPALFLEQFTPPLLLDEVQYVPNLFPELKKIIDNIKRSTVFQSTKTPRPTILFRLTGSNQILMDKNIQESLAGRASFYYLNTLCVHELLQAFPTIRLEEIIFKGGWPELYTNPDLPVTTYLNDYIRSYIEKDIILGAGIQKTAEFLTVIRLCAARTSHETDYSDIQKDSGVTSVTIKEWLGVLERANLIYQLKPYFNNLNKRLIKRPKLYFLDTGLAARLQGWANSMPLMSSPQIGGLFETLVLAEIVKFIHNYQKDWELFFWRTKEGQEVDFVLKTAMGEIHAFEAKLAIHGIPKTITYPPAFKKEFSPKKSLVVITAGGQRLKLSPDCFTLPLAELHDYLLTI